jgi:hypothetical protein
VLVVGCNGAKMRYEFRPELGRYTCEGVNAMLKSPLALNVKRLALE